MAYQNILLIDDDADDQEIFLSAMEIAADSVNCVAIGNAKEALKKLTDKDVAADLIFLDLNMPIMSGQQFLTEFKKLDSLKDIPVIILSTSSNPSTIRQTKEMGAREFITKPEKFNDLVVKLQSILD
ncbi:MAG: response regulator [Ferruginibacter sp.]